MGIYVNCFKILLASATEIFPGAIGKSLRKLLMDIIQFNADDDIITLYGLISHVNPRRE